MLELLQRLTEEQAPDRATTNAFEAHVGVLELYVWRERQLLLVVLPNPAWLTMPPDLIATDDHQIGEEKFGVVVTLEGRDMNEILEPHPCVLVRAR